MSITDLFWAADWDGLYRFFAKGNPPLALQMLVLNTLFLVLYIVRRATAKNRMRNQTTEIIQLLLLAANLAVILQEDMLKWVGPIGLDRLI